MVHCRKCVIMFQEQNRDLRAKQEFGTTKAETPQIEMFDFKSKFAETKAHAKVTMVEEGAEFFCTFGCSETK